MRPDYELIGEEDFGNHFIRLFYDHRTKLYSGDVEFLHTQVYGNVMNFTVYEPQGHWKNLEPILHRIRYGLDSDVSKSTSEKWKHTIAMLLLRKIKNGSTI